MKNGIAVATVAPMRIAVAASRPPMMFAGVRAVVNSSPVASRFVSMIAFIVA